MKSVNSLLHNYHHTREFFTRIGSITAFNKTQMNPCLVFCIKDHSSHRFYKKYVKSYLKGYKMNSGDDK